MEDIRNKYAPDESENSIELWPLVQALWRRWWLIALAALAFGAAALIGTRVFITPTYRASFTAYVNNRADAAQQTTLSNADLSASRYLTYTYAQIIRSRSVLETAAEQAGLSYDYAKLSKMVSTSILSDTEIICVYVQGENPTECYQYAQAIAEVATTEIAGIVDGSSMRLVDSPVVPTGIYSPSYAKNALVGFVIGFLLAAAGIILRELLDDRVKDEETLETRFGLPILGVIPNMNSAAKAGVGYYAPGKNGGKK